MSALTNSQNRCRCGVPICFEARTCYRCSRAGISQDTIHGERIQIIYECSCRKYNDRIQNKGSCTCSYRKGLRNIPKLPRVKRPIRSNE